MISVQHQNVTPALRWKPAPRCDPRKNWWRIIGSIESAGEVDESGKSASEFDEIVESSVEIDTSNRSSSIELMVSVNLLVQLVLDFLLVDLIVVMMALVNLI